MRVKDQDQYANLADLYDSLAADASLQAFYSEWRDSLLAAVRQYKVRVRVIVDLACGTGNTTVPWASQSGWNVIGVDRSIAMLRRARKKTSRVRWYCQDLRKLDLKECADLVTCHFDALNHVLDPQDLQKVFVNVARTLNEGGLFQFDMNTEAMFRWCKVHEKLFHIGPNCFMAYNEYDSKQRIGTFRQLWFVRKGKLYQKRTVKVRERAYTAAEIHRMLKKAGLDLLKREIQRKMAGKPTRVLYLVRKAKRASS
jgi:ubiquinone/menaquinone biosynthesis C-methylase UbiE